MVHKKKNLIHRSLLLQCCKVNKEEYSTIKQKKWEIGYHHELELKKKQAISRDSIVNQIKY